MFLKHGRGVGWGEGRGLLLGGLQAPHMGAQFSPAETGEKDRI